MAFLYDDQELRDKRIQTLLSTAVSLQQLKQQKEIANQENDYRMKALSQSLLANRADTQEKFAKLGYASSTPQSMNEQNMVSNPNRGSLSDVYGQQYTPNPMLLKAKQSNAMTRYTMDENGNLQALPGILVETPQQKMDRKNAGSTEDQKNQLQSNQNAMLVFDQLKQLSKGLESIGGYEGLAIKGGNVVTRGKLNPHAQAYADFMPAAAVNLYRGITGDTRLSDYDAKRAYSMVWDIGTDGSVKGIKESTINNLLAARNILLSNNIYATKKDEKITSLDDVAFVSNAVSHGVSEDKIISFLKNRKKK